MKKLIALIGAVATAFGLYAADFYGNSFETAQEGVSGETWSAVSPWSTIPADTVFNLGAYADDEPANVYSEDAKRRYYDEIPKLPEANANFLKLETGTNTLDCALDDLDTTGDKFYFDQLVKFTGFEEAPTFAADTKIAVWMSAVEQEGDDPEADGYVAGETNLYVQVGAGDGSTTNVMLQGTYAVDTWYRITIKSIGNVIDAESGSSVEAQLGFIVFVNGEQKAIVAGDQAYHKYASAFGTNTAAAKYYAAGQLFTSMVVEGDDVLSLAKVGYQGIGAIDDVVYSASAPDFDLTYDVEAPEIEGAVAVAVTQNGDVIPLLNGKYTLRPGTAIFTYQADGPFVLTGNGTLIVTVSAAGKLEYDEGEVEIEPATVQVTIGAEDPIYFADLDSAFEEIEGTDATVNVEMLDEVEAAECAYVFFKGTTIDINPEVKGVIADNTWQITVDNTAEEAEDFSATDAFGVAPEKQVYVTFNDERGFLKLAGNVYGNGRVDTLLDVDGQVQLVGGLTVGAKLVAEDGAGAVLKFGTINLNGNKITLAGKGKVISENALTADMFTNEAKDLKIEQDPETELWTAQIAGTVKFTLNAPANATVTEVKDAEGNVIEAKENVYEADPNAELTVTLTANDGYLFGDGKTTTETITAADGEITLKTAAPAQAGFAIIIAGEPVTTNYYPTLAAAAAAAKNGNTVVMFTNASADGLTVAADVTLDLNGNLLTVTEGFTSTTDITLVNSDSANGGFYVANKVNVNGGTLDASALTVAQGGVIPGQPNGGIIVAKDAMFVMMDVWSTYSPNWLAANREGFLTAANGGMVQMGNKVWTAQDGVFVVDGAVAKAKVESTHTGGKFEFVDTFDTLAAAVAAVKAGETVTILAACQLEKPVKINKAVTLDIGDFTVTPKAAFTRPSGSKETIDALFVVNYGGDFTVVGDEGVIDCSAYPTIYSPIKLTEYGESFDGETRAKLTVNANLKGYYYAIVGNGNRNGTDIVINGGTLQATAADTNVAVYCPQDGTVEINDGTLIGLDSAIEIRSGTLTINGGTLTATAAEFACKPNGDGSTSVGAAVAVAQHTTKQNITVTINGGTLTGVKAVSVSNPQLNPPAESVAVTLGDATYNGELYYSASDIATVSNKGADIAAPEGYVWDDGILVAIALPTAEVEAITATGYDVAAKFTALTKGAGYDDWQAKFLLTSDVAIGADEIMLGGQYEAALEDYAGGWIDIPFAGCEANEPVVIAENLDVTVADLFEFVKVFNCGVKNIALKNNAKFKLELVISDPDEVEEDVKLCDIADLAVAAKTYDITFKVDDQADYVTNVVVGTELSTVVPADPKKDGFEFKGWDPAVTGVAESNATYTAQFEEVETDITITVNFDENITSVKVDGQEIESGNVKLKADTKKVTITLAADSLTIPVFKNGDAVVAKSAEYDVEDKATFSFTAEEAKADDPTVPEADKKAAIIAAIDEGESHDAAVAKVNAVVGDGDGQVTATALATYITDKSIQSPDLAASEYVAASVKLGTDSLITEETKVEVATVEKTTSDLAVTIKIGDNDATKDQIMSFVEVCDDLGAANDWEKLPTSTLKSAVQISDGKLVITPVAGIDKLFLKVSIPKDPGAAK